MKLLKIWDKEFPLYNPEINNTENDNINTISFCSVETDKPLPVVLIFPGGGYSFRNESDEGTPTAEFLNSQGMHVAVVNYRVSPYRYPAPLMDAQRAIKLLRYHAKKLQIDPDRIFVLGFSAGGHLCGMTATFPDVANQYGDEIDNIDHKPNGALLCYPVVSADDDKMHRGSFENLLGEDYTQKQDYSIEKNVNENTCPCFLFHCENDTLVPAVNSIVLADSLRKTKVPYELHIFRNGCHGGGIKKDDPLAHLWPILAANWVKNFK